MRGNVWKSLFKQKGWLEGVTIKVPRNVKVYFNFLGGEHHTRRDLAWIVETTDDFLVFRPSSEATQYYLWEDIVSIDIHS